MPEIPVSVWEQIQVIIVFALLLAGGAMLMVRAFSNAVDKINQNYATIIENSNKQWQTWFDAKNEKNEQVSQDMMTDMKELTKAIQHLRNDLGEHDNTMRGALDRMEVKRAKLSRTKNAK